MQYTLGKIADRIGREIDTVLIGDSTVMCNGIAALARAKPSEIGFFADSRLVEDAEQSRAGALLVTRHWSKIDKPQLVCSTPDDARRALALLLELFRPAITKNAVAGIDPRAAVDPCG